MQKFWVLAADSSEARLFAREKKRGPLEEIDRWSHPKSTLHGHELETDAPGSTFSSQGPGRDEMAASTGPKEQEAEAFAGEVAKRLDKARRRGQFEHLEVVADPTFLGLLRKRLGDQTGRLIGCEVDKNMTRHSPQKIAEALETRRA